MQMLNTVERLKLMRQRIQHEIDALEQKDCRHLEGALFRDWQVTQYCAEREALDQAIQKWWPVYEQQQKISLIAKDIAESYREQRL